MTEKEISIKLAEYRARNANLKLPEGFVPKIPLMSHQVIPFYYTIKLAGSALFLDQGTGKTAVAINAVRYRIEKGQATHALVIAPNNVLINWEEEIAKFSNLRSIILHSPNRQRRLNLFNEDAEFYIINYNAASIFLEELTALNPSILICDESTRIKNVQAARTKAIIKLSRFVKYKMILTGTPLTNSPMDIFTQIHMLDPGIWDHKNFYQWRYRYFKDVGTYFPNWVPKSGTLDTLQKKIYQIAVRYTKEECLDLPPKIYQNLYVELNKDQWEASKSIQNRLEIALGEKKVNAPYIINQLIKLSQIESGWIKSDIIRDEQKKIIEDGDIYQLGKGNSKLEVIFDLLDDLPMDKKVIIWFRFVYSIKLVEQLVKKKGFKYVTYFGETKPEDKKVAVRKFQEEKDIKIFLGQMQSGGLGVNLTAADTVIYFELMEDSEMYLQSQDRSHRIGSEVHESITYIHLLVKDGVGEKTLKALKEKKTLSEIVVERRKL